MTMYAIWAPRKNLWFINYIVQIRRFFQGQIYHHFQCQNHQTHNGWISSICTRCHHYLYHFRCRHYLYHFKCRHLKGTFPFFGYRSTQNIRSVPHFFPISAYFGYRSGPSDQESPRIGPMAGQIWLLHKTLEKHPPARLRRASSALSFIHHETNHGTRQNPINSKPMKKRLYKQIISAKCQECYYSYIYSHIGTRYPGIVIRNLNYQKNNQNLTKNAPAQNQWKNDYINK